MSASKMNASSLSLFAALFASTALAQLPPNHPVVPEKPGQSSAARPLPEGHPPMGSGAATQTAQPLPPGHPPAGTTAAPPTGTLPPGHPPAKMTGAPPPSSEELLRRLDETPSLRDREKTFDIAYSVAKLYHANGRYTDAAEYYRQAWELGKVVRTAFAKVRNEKVDASSCQQNITIDQVAAQLPTLDAKQRSACLHRWMDAVAEAAVLRSESLFLAGDAKGAVAALDTLLAEAPRDGDALFARGSILLETKGDDLSALKKARADFAAAEASDVPAARATRARLLRDRADALISAGGATRFAARQAEARKSSPLQPTASAPVAAGPNGATAGGNMPQLSQETINAFQNVERTPELEARLAKLIEDGEGHLAKGRFQDALDQYRQVMPLDPNNGRVRAGLAWAMVGLQKPAADRIWTVAVQSDPGAVDTLGQTLKAKGDAQGAKALWTKLAGSAPDYAQKSGLAEKLR